MAEVEAMSSKGGQLAIPCYSSSRWIRLRERLWHTFIFHGMGMVEHMIVLGMDLWSFLEAETFI